MENVKGLFFDVGGTVFDWKNTARGNIQKLADEKGESIDSEAFANEWRGEMFKVHSQVRQGNLPWMNSDDMHLRALANMTSNYPLLDKIDKASLIKSTWHHLKPFIGAPEAIERLRTKYTVVCAHYLELGEHRQQFQKSPGSMGRHPVVRVFRLLQALTTGLPESDTGFRYEAV